MAGQKERAEQRQLRLLAAANIPPDTKNLDRMRRIERSIIDAYEESRLLDLKATNALKMMEKIWRRLGLNPDAGELAGLVPTFERGMLDSPPKLAPHIRPVLATLARQYKLGIISDTLFAPGRIIRSYLEQFNLLHYFDVAVFSDETGVVKPHIHAFQTALKHLNALPEQTVHIGDLVRTDIKGARSAGMYAIQYTGLWTDQNRGTAADAILEDWRDLPKLFLKLPDGYPGSKQ
jgi:putative hydrolase of the HAD superfamily